MNRTRATRKINIQKHRYAFVLFSISTHTHYAHIYVRENACARAQARTHMQTLNMPSDRVIKQLGSIQDEQGSNKQMLTHPPSPEAN